MTDWSVRCWICSGCLLCACGGGSSVGDAIVGDAIGDDDFDDGYVYYPPTGGGGGGGGSSSTPSEVETACKQYCEEQALLNCPSGEAAALCSSSCSSSSASGCAARYLEMKRCMSASELSCDFLGYPAVGQECFEEVNDFLACDTTGGPPPHVNILGCVQEEMVEFDYPLSNIVFENSRAYFFLKSGNSCYGLFVYDVSNPAAPIELGKMEGVCADDFAVKEAVVYATKKSPDLLVAADLSNPTTPVNAGFVSIWGQIAISGDTAYLQDSIDLIPVDITNPGAMTPGETVLAEGVDLRVVGNVLFASGVINTLSAFDLSEPLSPTSIGMWGSGVSHRSTVAVNGTALFVVDDSGVYPYDVANPLAPRALPPYLTEFELSFDPRDIAFIGNTAYLTSTSGLSTLDVSNLESIRAIDTFEVSDAVGHVAASGNYLYLTTELGGSDKGRLHVLRCK